MTNNTIPNVPRELLEELRDAANESMNATTRQHQIDHLAGLIAKVDALLSAPSPAGVDGLEVVGTVATMGFGRHCISADFTACDKLKVGDPVTAMLPAQAIIDGLRGENERIRLNIAEYNESIACYQSERDQQAQRIGELEGLLRAESARVDFLDAYIVTADAPDTGKAAMLADSGTLRECIDAALSAGKEGE